MKSGESYLLSVDSVPDSLLYNISYASWGNNTYGSNIFSSIISISLKGKYINIDFRRLYMIGTASSTFVDPVQLLFKTTLPLNIV